MSKYHYRVTKFSKPFDEDDDQLKAMFWQAVAENLKGTDNLNTWLESSKTDVSTWKLLEGDTDYKLLVCSYAATQEDVALVDKIASRIGVVDWGINYVLECYKHSRPFVIVGAAEYGGFDSIYFMERVDKDQLTDMEYTLNNLPKKQVETIKIGDTVTLGYWEQSDYHYWYDYSGSQGVVTSIGWCDATEVNAKNLNEDIEIEIPIEPFRTEKRRVRWPVYLVTKDKPDVTYSADDEKSWY